jgi:class 3 adenylate cyclase
MQSIRGKLSYQTDTAEELGRHQADQGRRGDLGQGEGRRPDERRRRTFLPADGTALNSAQLDGLGPSESVRGKARFMSARVTR